MKYLLLAILLALPSVALAYEPPQLVSPEVCTLSTGGGLCEFAANEDGIVVFPDSRVTGKVTVKGGRNVHVRGGYLKLGGSSRTAFALQSIQNIFIEGLHVDSNGYCDVFAIQSPPDGVVATITFQNIYAEGPKYNVVDGNCHGDLIQSQTGKANRGWNLRIENFIGVTGAQGFFLPFYSTLTATAELRNVYIRVSGNTKPLLWFSNGSPPYPVTLDNVWVDASASKLYPNTRIQSADGQRVFWPGQEMITGFVNRGFDVDEEAFKAHVGLNYDPAYFGADPIPDPDPTVPPHTHDLPAHEHLHAHPAHTHPPHTHTVNPN